jgi:polysaccharide deacetylase 2 family uncharacterized protein YibQ
MAAQFWTALPSRGLLSGWRGLGRFWLAVLAVLGVGAGVLQTLGPTSTAPPPRPAIGPTARSDPHPATPEVHAQAAVPHAPAGPERPGRPIPGPVADPDPGLLEPYPGEPDRKLPRISVDGRPPMAVYAASFDPTSVRPRVGILIAGIGMSGADSLAAIKELPGPVTFAISPYATNIDRLLALARMTEHEYLLSLPMEPQGYPVNDPDDRHALMTSLSPEENLDRLRWAMSRIGGYAGITSLLGPMRGERLLGVSDQRDSMLEEVARRGLLFVDGRTGQARLPKAWNRSADMVIDDDPADEASLDQRLEALSRMAKDKGSALGIVSVPRPVTLDRIAAWTNSLTAKGLALAPVSALVLPPATQGSDK